MSKELETLDRIYGAVGDCEIGSRYYDLELPKDIEVIRKALEEKEKQDELINILFKIGLIDHIIGRLGCMNTRTEEGKKERRFLLDFVEANIKRK